MGKRAALAFFLSLLIIIGYNYIVSKKYPVSAPQRPLEQKKELDVASSPALQPQEKESPFVAKTVQGAEEILVETDLMKIAIISSGARIKSCQLKKYAEEKLNPKNIQNRIDEVEKTLSNTTSETKEILQREREKLGLLLKKLSKEPGRAELISLAALLDADFSPTLIFPEQKEKSGALNTAVYQFSKDSLTLNSKHPEEEVEFIYIDERGRKIKKRYSFTNSNYNIGLELKFLGWEKEDLPTGYFLLSWGPDVGMPLAKRGRRTYGYEGPVTYFLNAQEGWVQKEKYSGDESQRYIRRQRSGKIGWTALENKYFLSALIPLQAVEGVIIEKSKFDEQRVALKVPWQGSGSYNFALYLGPKKRERLKQVNPTLTKTIDYGFFGPIARLIYQILVFFSRWTHNFGWAIILLCFVVKIVFYPLTHHSFESMQKMQQQMKSVQPEMDALRQKYKDNPQKLNKEVLALYRKKGVNPLASCQSGCLPLLLQLPVFFALYAVLYNSIELRGTPFVGWIKDLSTKDPYYILPVLMGISMFIQQKLTGMSTAGGAQQEQARLMGIIMPLFLTWIFASLPSGVVLYWLSFNIITSLQQLLIRKKQKVVTAV